MRKDCCLGNCVWRISPYGHQAFQQTNRTARMRECSTTTHTHTIFLIVCCINVSGIQTVALIARGKNLSVFALTLVLGYNLCSDTPLGLLRSPYGKICFSYLIFAFVLIWWSIAHTIIPLPLEVISRHLMIGHSNTSSSNMSRPERPSSANQRW